MTPKNKDTKKSLEETQKELNDANNRVQSLANLIEEADVSIQSLMEERDSLHTSVSETIKKYNEVEKDYKTGEAKIKKYEAQLAAMENEASTALDNLASKLADQERKWQEKFEREEKKWQLRLLEATMKQDEGKETQTPFKDDDFKDFDPNKGETTSEKDTPTESDESTGSASGA